jgi:hypothetical protein
MLSVLKYGGFKTGGVNFDAKVRRESFEPIDLFYAHIGGMDAFARGLKIAAAIRKDGRLAEFVKQRYASWDSGHRREDRIRQGRFQGTRSVHAQAGRSDAQRQRSPGIPGELDQRVYLKRIHLMNGLLENRQLHPGNPSIKNTHQSNFYEHVDLKQFEVWFVTGSQHLYGPETLKKVAEHSQEIARALNVAPAIPVKVVFKPVLVTPDAVTELCQAANNAAKCIGPHHLVPHVLAVQDVDQRSQSNCANRSCICTRNSTATSPGPRLTWIS